MLVFDTVDSYVKIYDTTFNNEDITVFSVGGGYESAIYKDKNRQNELVFNYTKLFRVFQGFLYILSNIYKLTLFPLSNCTVKNKMSFKKTDCSEFCQGHLTSIVNHCPREVLQSYYTKFSVYNQSFFTFFIKICNKFSSAFFGTLTKKKIIVNPGRLSGCTGKAVPYH